MDAIVEEPEPECEFDGPWKEAIEAQGNSGNCRSCVAFTIRGLDKRRVRLLFRLIDWIMTLSPPREFDFLQEVSKTEEKQAVPFISPADVASLNTFLAAYGKLPDIALTVVIHTGSKPVTDALGGEQKMPYDWSVEIYRRGWGTPNDPRQTEKEPGYVVSVHVWLSDAITLKNLEIPKHIDDVRSAGEIEQFIGKHRRGEVGK